MEGVLSKEELEAVHCWEADDHVPRRPELTVRFAHSPGRLDPAWLGNLVELDVAFVLDLGDGTQGIVGVVTAYHRTPRTPVRHLSPVRRGAP